jgi:hypothetical protein
MKKAPLILIVFLTIFQVTEAQKFSIGCKVGMDLVNIRFDPTGDNWGVTNRLSYDFGLITFYSPLKMLQIQIESGFIEKGGRIKYKYVDEKTLYKYGYFSNQLIFIFKPIRRLNIEIGSEIGHTLYATMKDIPGQTFKYRLSDYKKNDFSAIVGLGFNFFKNTYVDVRYVYGFTPLEDCFVLVEFGPSYHYQIYNKYISLGLRYYFINIK